VCFGWLAVMTRACTSLSCQQSVPDFQSNIKRVWESFRISPGCQVVSRCINPVSLTQNQFSFGRQSERHPHTHTHTHTHTNTYHKVGSKRNAQTQTRRQSTETEPHSWRSGVVTQACLLWHCIIRSIRSSFGINAEIRCSSTTCVTRTLCLLIRTGVFTHYFLPKGR